MAETTTNSDAELHVRVDVKPATVDGLTALVVIANKFLAENPHWRLLTITRLEKTVAAVYVRAGNKPGAKVTEPWPEDDIEV